MTSVSLGEEQYKDDIDSMLGEHAPSAAEHAQEEIDEVVHHEQDDLAADLLAPHPKGIDTNDNSGEFEALVNKIDAAQTEQERVVHYRDALSMVTDNRLGEQGMKIADVALLLTGIMVGLSPLAAKTIKSIFVISVVMYLDHQLPEAYRLGLRDKSKIVGISAMSTAVVGWLPEKLGESTERGINWILGPVDHMFDGLEYAMEGAVNWVPGVAKDIELGDYLTGPIRSFAGKLAGLQEFLGAGVGEWFFNSTYAVFTIFYNHLQKKYEQSLADLQELQQQASEENQDEIIQLKQDIIALQAGMTEILDQQGMEK